MPAILNKLTNNLDWALLSNQSAVKDNASLVVQTNGNDPLFLSQQLVGVFKGGPGIPNIPISEDGYLFREIMRPVSQLEKGKFTSHLMSKISD